MATENFPPERNLSKEWLTEDQVLDLMKMCPNTFKNMRKKVGLPCSSLGVKRYYNSADIQHLHILSRRQSL